MKFCESIKCNPFSITPLTFVLDCLDEFCESNFNSFLKVYEDYLPKNLKQKNINISEIKRSMR